MAVELATGYISLVPSAEGFAKKLGKEIEPGLEKVGKDAGADASKAFAKSFDGGLSQQRFGHAFDKGMASSGISETARARGESTASRFGAGFSTVAATVGVGAFVGVGKELYKLGADLEQLNAKATIVFGDQIGVVEKWAKSSANAMGLTKSEATGLAAGMTDLLVPMGFTRELATKMSTETIGLSGALAAWSGGQKTATEVAEILQAAMLGEYDSLKSLGIGLSAFEVDQVLVTKGQQALTGAARQQAEAMAVQELVFAKSKDAQAAYGDAVISTNEKLAMQSAKFREAKEALATNLTPAVNQAVIGLNQFVVAGTQATATSGGLQGAAFRFGAAWADANADLNETNGILGKLIDKMQQANKLNPTYQLGKAVGGLFRADGGPVSAGRPYIVGEKGPELFMPAAAGRIVSNAQLAAYRPSKVEMPAGGAPSGPSITQNIYPAQGRSEAEIGRIAAREAVWAMKT